MVTSMDFYFKLCVFWILCVQPPEVLAHVYTYPHNQNTSSPHECEGLQQLKINAKQLARLSKAFTNLEEQVSLLLAKHFDIRYDSNGVTYIPKKLDTGPDASQGQNQNPSQNRSGGGIDSGDAELPDAPAGRNNPSRFKKIKLKLKSGFQRFKSYVKRKTSPPPDEVQ